jgi:diguanylate cyclase (GGDEF)-like protein
MEKFGNYILQEKIHETRNSIIYRGHKENESQSFIVKQLKTKYPTPSEIARFRQEYELIKSLDLEGVIKTFDIISPDDGFALILEDFDGVSIKSLMDNNKRFDIKSFLEISAKIAETLGNLHLKDVIHLDIKPHNVLINPITEDVKITDFGISAILTHENDEVYNPDFIAGTLAYMSPEQTGRMNRAVDYRTDLYSFGVTLYEILTGNMPFKSQDPMELIHSHLAVMPESPARIDHGIPVVISDIIMKLLSKNPEGRYQNSFGLMADIEECLRQINSGDSIDEFPLASKDLSIKLNIPQIIVGREEESNLLLSAFERSTRGANEMMFVLGPPGIGKSALINEIQRPIVAKKGYFIFGKYDQFRKDVPYSSIIQAFQNLIKQLLSESDDRINSWREKLIAALGPNGRVIIDVIPDMEYVIGKQPDIESLGPEESQNRFNTVCQNFINVFTTADHPLTLFLDDLQWADLASLNLIKKMTGSATKFLFFIGAYRDNEVGPHHPLSITLDEIQKKGKKISSISLTPLNAANVNKMIMNVLRCKEEESASLAELIHKKTGGSPFFVSQFLKNLYDSKVIYLDPKTDWIWDMDKIQKMQFTDNVVEFMAEKILSLPVNTQEILKVCACIGNRFDLETLSIVTGKTIEEVLADITAAIQEEMISLYGNIYKFHHDRIQEAVYSLIPDNEKTRLHYLIGKNMLEKTPGQNLHDKIFYIVDQLNRGMDLVTKADEKLQLAEMNLKAAQRAKNSTAYASASSYLKTGIGLLPDDCWENHYELTYSMYRETMECEYLTLNFDEAERIFSIVIKNATSIIDKANSYSMMVILYTSQGNYDKAVNLGLQGMRMVGITIPRKVSEARLGIALVRLYFSFGKKKIEDLVDLPMMSNPEMISFGYLVINTGTVAYYTDANLFSMIVIRGIYIFKKYGNYEFTPFGYNAMGGIIGSGLGFFQQGYRFGLTSLKVNEKIPSNRNHGRMEFLFALVIQHWIKHAKFDVDFYRNAYKNCLESGDHIFAGHSVNLLVMTRIMLGDNIDEILEECGNYKDFQLGGKDPFIARNYSENTWMCLCLKGDTVSRGSLNSGDFNEEEQIAYYRKEKNFLGIFYFLLIKLRTHYLFGEYGECLPIAEELHKLAKKKIAIGNLHVPEVYFYYSLALAASYSSAGIGKKMKFKSRLLLNQMKMKKWAKNCPENFLHKFLLINAERARLKGNLKKAMTLYDEAIKSAHENKYTQNEAIANELAAMFYISKGYDKIGKSYLKDAYQCCEKWGATAKLREMEKAYPYLIMHKTKAGSLEDTYSTTLSSDTGMTSSTLDMSTIMKVSQAISSEIILDRLIKTIMKIAVVNAGAQKGFFILDTDGKLSIEAAEEEGKEDILSKMQSMPLDACNELSKAIVNYVHRSGEDVILGNASMEGPFTNDPHILNSRCKSILCTTIKSKGKISGILYMENNLTDNAFTPERIEPLRIILSQAAISIENARLFELATTDGMTKLYVHRYFQLLLDQEMHRSRRYNKIFSLIMMDIDNFKDFNDTYGHQLGDEVLKSVARAVKNILRANDVTARYGGEEFVVILPETDAPQAMIAAEKIRAIVESLEIVHGEERLHVTISLGVAAFPQHAGEKEELIRLADEALYTSKHKGKNRVSLSEK